MRFQIVINHGENGSVYMVIDTVQPEREQPCVIESWNTNKDKNARYLAMDFCNRHNAKGY